MNEWLNDRTETSKCFNKCLYFYFCKFLGSFARAQRWAHINWWPSSYCHNHRRQFSAPSSGPLCRGIVSVPLWWQWVGVIARAEKLQLAWCERESQRQSFGKTIEILCYTKGKCQLPKWHLIFFLFLYIFCYIISYCLFQEFITMESVTKHELSEMQKESLKKGNNKCHTNINNNRKLGRVNFIVSTSHLY